MRNNTHMSDGWRPAYLPEQIWALMGEEGLEPGQLFTEKDSKPKEKEEEMGQDATTNFFGKYVTKIEKQTELLTLAIRGRPWMMMQQDGKFYSPNGKLRKKAKLRGQGPKGVSTRDKGASERPGQGCPSRARVTTMVSGDCVIFDLGRKPK